jgi:hypothetical protein
MTDRSSLQQHLLYLLKGDGAHVDFEAAVKDLPAELHGKRPQGAGHSPWEVLEHLRICQWDVLESLRTPGHASPEFPAGYWPATQTPPDAHAWEKSVSAFRGDFETIVALVSAPSTDLLAPLPQGEGQTVLRKLMMLADHNAYHLGELVLLRRLLGGWQ